MEPIPFDFLRTMKGHLADLALYEKHPDLPSLADVWKAEGIDWVVEGDRIKLTFPDGHTEYREAYAPPFEDEDDFAARIG